MSSTVSTPIPPKPKGLKTFKKSVKPLKRKMTLEEVCNIMILIGFL